MEPEINLPPLPLECDLFFPQIYGRRETISEYCSCLLDWLDSENTLMFDVDEVSKTLDIDPKKLLLILQVLECVQIVTKTKGSRYSWNGIESLVESLTWLELLAKKERMLEQLYNIGQFQGDFPKMYPFKSFPLPPPFFC